MYASKQLPTIFKPRTNFSGHFIVKLFFRNLTLL